MRTVRIITVLAMAGLLLATIVGPATARKIAGSATGGAPLSAEMDGDQEIVGGDPGGGDPDATGFAIATINPGQGVACYELTHDLELPPHAFHIHVGEAGVNGPVVVNFFTGVLGADVVPDSGCVDIDRGLATDILANPAGYYFNAHNEEFPPGAIRGQLDKSSR